MKEQSIKDLVMRLNKIRALQDKLAIEHNKVVHQLIELLPHLKDDEDIQPVKLEGSDSFGRRYR